MSDPIMPTGSGNDSAELQLLYSASVADIAFFKQQQWVVTNHALVLQAAVFGVGQLSKEPIQSFELWILLLLVVITAGVGLFILYQLRNSVEARRTRLQNVRERFGWAFNEAWAVSKEADHVHHFLAFVQVVAALLVSWLVVCRV